MRAVEPALSVDYRPSGMRLFQCTLPVHLFISILETKNDILRSSACICSDIENRFTIKLMKEGLIDTSIGSVECSLEEILREDGEGKSKLVFPLTNIN